MRETVLALAVSAGVAGPLVAYFVAAGEAEGPIYSGWQILFLLGAVACAGLGVIAGLLTWVAPLRGVALLTVVAGVYVMVLILMFRRYRPDPIWDGLLAGGPFALLLLVGAGLTYWRVRQ